MDVNCYKFINLEYMEMMADGDESMKKIMLEMLVDELPQEIDKLSELCQAGNWPDVGAISHKLKSTLAFVGNDEMTNANKNIESYAKDNSNVALIPDLVLTLKKLCPNTLAELNQELERL